MKLSKNYFRKRLFNFRKVFSSMGVEGFIIENPIDLTYFTGLKLSAGRLLMSKTHVSLFVDGRYTTYAKERSPYPVKNLGKTELETLLNTWKEPKIFGFDTNLSFASYQTIKSSFSKSKKKLKGVTQPTLKVRAIKDSYELAHLKNSAALLWKGFTYIRKKLKVGISEIDLSQAFELYIKKKGAESLAFPPIIAFGENSALPHHQSSTRELRKGDIVLIDIGIIVNGYASDMTRSLFFGLVSNKIKELFKIVKKAHGAALEKCLAGQTVATLDKVAREVMGKEEKHFIHALGHGIGLEVHESPRISFECQEEILQAGMVITVEPGLYVPKLGGIRYEDMIIITKNGYQNLFKETKP